MGKFFDLIEELLEKLFKHHTPDPKKLDEILNNQEDEKVVSSAIQADILSIKAFFGIPDARIGATQEQVDALGTRVQGETDTINQFDASVQEPPPSQ